MKKVLQIPLPVKAVGEVFTIESAHALKFERAGIAPGRGVPVVWCTAECLPDFKNTYRLVVVCDGHVFADEGGSPFYVGSWWEADITFHLYELTFRE